MSKDRKNSPSLPEINDKKPVMKEDHQKTLNYLSNMRVQRIEAEKKEANSSLEGSTEDSRNDNKPISDTVFSKILNDKNMNEFERMEAIRLRAVHIEEKAFMSEQKLRNNSDGMSISDIAQNNAVNDVYMDSIKAKLSILEKV